MNGSKVTSAGARFLDRYPSLSTLYLSGPTVDDKYLDEVCDVPGLSSLDFGGVQVTKAGMRHLQKLSTSRCKPYRLETPRSKALDCDI